MSLLLRSIPLLRNICLHRRTFLTSPALKKSILDVNTKTSKDVILFKYENPKFFKVLNTFSIVQFGLMMYMSHFVFTALKDVPVSEKVESQNVVWWRKVNLGEKKYRNSFATLCAVLGYLVLCGSWMFTLRSVRFLILRKGGNSVSFVTYGPFGKNRITTVPMNKVSSMESRTHAKVQLPIKVQGHYFHYMLDMRGEFLKTTLYDASVGLQRSFR